jgi:hypothetical protein
MNLALAVKFGTNESLFLTNLCYWIEKNKANRVHFHDGHYWVYNTMEAWAELFPYFSKDQIRRLISKMKSRKILLVGVYNRIHYDRTQWYSVSDEVMALYLGGFRKEESGQGEQKKERRKGRNLRKSRKKKATKILLNLPEKKRLFALPGRWMWRKSRIHLPQGAHGCGGIATWKRRIRRIDPVESPQQYHIINL